MNTTQLTASTTWVQASTSDTGACLVQNTSTGGGIILFRFVDDGSDPSATDPTGGGGILLSGQAVSRGDETGHVWVRTASGGLPVAVTQ